MTYPNQPQQWQQPQQPQYQQPQQYQQPAQQPAPQPAPVAPPPQPAPQPVVPSKAKVLGEQLKRVIGSMGWAVQSDAEIPNGYKVGFKNTSKKINKGDVINFEMTISAVTAPPAATPGLPPAQPQAGSHNIGVATVAKKSFFSKDKKTYTHWIDIANFVGDDMAPRPGIEEQIKNWLIEDGIHKPTPPPAPVAPPVQPPAQPVAQPQQPQYQQQAQQAYDQAQQAGYVDQGQQYAQQQAPAQWPPKPTQ